ncbi:MSHA biogenesis protein MshQ [Vibrio sp. JCM 19052]|nr:MSHA biogenesis protein MshQ [Vibrio sp. JCM 19052]
MIVKVTPNDIDAISLDSNYTLSFTMVDDMSKAQTVQFMFTPYMFEAYAEDLSSLDEIHVIAGKSKTVNTRLLACAATGEQVIATNYDGTPKVTHPLIKPVGGSEGNFSYSAEFKDGLSSMV